MTQALKAFCWVCATLHESEIIVIARDVREARKLAARDGQAFPIVLNTRPIVVTLVPGVFPRRCYACLKAPCKCHPIPFG